MGIFKRLAARSIAPPADTGARAPADLHQDDHLGDEASRTWATRLTAGEDLAFRAYLATETDTERRDFTIEAVLNATGQHGEWVDRWVQEEPDSALAHMVLGRRLVHWAWLARTHLRAENVSAEQFDRFFERLRHSWRAFERAIELDPDEASIYTLMLDAAKGLQLDVDTKLRLYAAAQSRRPWQQMAHQSVVQGLAPKWIHSSEAMLAFVQRTTETAPRGSAVHGAVAEAHVEMHVDVGSGHWRTPGVRESVIAAAERSIEAPELVASPWLPRVRSAFAFCFWQLDERERARAQFELLGPLVAGPFTFYSDPLKTAAAARREVGVGRRGWPEPAPRT